MFYVIPFRFAAAPQAHSAVRLASASTGRLVDCRITVIRNRSTILYAARLSAVP